MVLRAEAEMRSGFSREREVMNVYVRTSTRGRRFVRSKLETALRIDQSAKSCSEPVAPN
jgi:hypothetical protein